MSMKYIRDTYNVPCKRGAKVLVRMQDVWNHGVITSASHYVVVKPNIYPSARLRFHPTDTDNLIYL